MKKYEIVKSHDEFNKIIHAKKYVKNYEFVIYYQPHLEDYPKFGIAISNKFGDAVTRNHYKRQIRNIIDNNKNNFKKENNYIIMIKRSCLNVSYNNLNNSLIRLIKEI